MKRAIGTKQSFLNVPLKKHAPAADADQTAVTTPEQPPAPPRAPVQAPPPPLAARMRPAAAREFVGQEDVATFLLSLLTKETDGGAPLPSLILWGPSGSGKTSFARVVARARSDYETVSVSATSTGAPELRNIMERAKADRKLRKVRTLLFLDEIHRLNKAQQDVLLPYVEDGTVTVLGCTTENPSFEVNTALLSRAKVVVFKKLSPPAVHTLLRNALADPRGLNGTVAVDDATLSAIVSMADGDARVALNTLEMCAGVARGAESGGAVVDGSTLKTVLQRSHLAYSDEHHFDLISALHKSIRGGSANAAVYYTMRMLMAGDDPLYLARRFIRAASEDVGLADSQALPLAVAAFEACHKIGVPECHVNLCHIAAYLANAPKSIHVYCAMKEIRQLIESGSNPMPPIHLCNAPTQLMKTLGYGHDYVYTPQAPSEDVALAQTYLPDSIGERDFLHLDTLVDRMDYGQQWKKHPM